MSFFQKQSVFKVEFYKHHYGDLKLKPLRLSGHDLDSARLAGGKALVELGTQKGEARLCADVLASHGGIVACLYLEGKGSELQWREVVQRKSSYALSSGFSTEGSASAGNSEAAH